jgi:flagellar protein FliO/FliZ
MFDSLGSEMPLAVKFFIAFAVVLVLIVLTAWLVRRFGANRLGDARGRQPRLAVIDAAAVDGRRRLVLIRRDNIEHLLMIGGPTDVVVEANIVRAIGARETPREQPARVAPEPTQRPAAAPAAPASESSWPLQPSSEPAPIAALRPSRTNATEEPWLPPEPGARARPAADLSGLTGELSARLKAPDLGPPPVRAEARPSTPAPSPQIDHNLAEMAQQLEAALRRTPIAEGRPPVTDPLAAPTAKVEPVRAREAKPRIEPKFDAKPQLEPKPEPKLETKPEPKAEAEPKLEPVSTPGKTLYDSLEQEMANLLGRPPGKS